MKRRILQKDRSGFVHSIGYYKDEKIPGQVQHYGFTIDGKRSAYVWRSAAEAIEHALDGLWLGEILFEMANEQLPTTRAKNP